MAINTSSIAHIRLTVTDITRSREFYESVFNWPINLEMPEDADDATRERFAFLFGGVIYNVGDSRVACAPWPTTGSTNIAPASTTSHSGSPASPNSTMRQRISTELGVAHEPIKDIGVMYILEFRDPDNIALELVAPK